jgi:hypothetical protein
MPTWELKTGKPEIAGIKNQDEVVPPFKMKILRALACSLFF